MTYKIIYSYETGDTFETRDAEREFDYTFNSEELAQDALQRMKEHYYWQVSEDNYRYKDTAPQPAWWKKEPKQAAYVSPNNWSFNIVGNDGEDFWLYAGPYLGYFETLYSAEVVSVETKSNKNKIVF